jgi:hypothetical protein
MRSLVVGVAHDRFDTLAGAHPTDRPRAVEPFDVDIEGMKPQFDGIPVSVIPRPLNPSRGWEVR